MSFLFGGGSKTKPQYTGLQTQTSSSSVPVAIVMGENRIPPNIIWQGDFQSHKHKQGGKGFGGGATSYTYSASFELMLCWGPITGVNRVWKDQDKNPTLSSLGMSLFTGTTPQAPWGYLSSAHAAQALGYPGVAYTAVANYDLGQSNALPQHSFEVQGALYNTQVGGVGDADPAQAVNAFLFDTNFGLGSLDPTLLDNTSLLSGSLATTTGDNAYQTYCRAMGFGLSPCLADQEAASDILKRWTDLTNTALVWTGYSLKFVPYGPDTVTANGVTYLPAFPSRYTLTDKDFVVSGPEEDPITFTRNDVADSYNSVSITISNRTNEYNDLPVVWNDQGLIDQYGLRVDSGMTAREVCVPGMAAVMVALMGQRQAYVRNIFSFKLGVAYSRLEPMDVVTVVDAVLGTITLLVTEIEEGSDDELQITAEEYNASVSSPGSFTNQAPSNTPINTGVAASAINPPLILEPPSTLAGEAEVWAAVSGGNGTAVDPNWGGCYVWLSTTGSTYNKIGEITQPARMGKTTATLASFGGTNPDTTNTLAVSTLMSDGELVDSTSTDAAAGNTVSYVGGEYLSFVHAALTGTDAYNLTTLYRGQYGSAAASHASGVPFARLDDAIFKYPLPPAYIGVTLYLKFQSYNIFGGGVQDLATCTAYTITPTGSGYGGGTGGVPTTPTGVTYSAGTVAWAANPTTDNVTNYAVYRAAGSGSAFGTATKVTTVSALSWFDNTAVAGTAYTYFVVATNAVGPSANSAGVNVSLAATGQPYGFAFTKTPTASKTLAAFDSPLAWTLPASLPDCQGTIIDSDTASAGAPASQTDFDIQSPLGTSIGTMRFAAGSLTATFIKTSGSTLPLGQPTYIVAPAGLNGITGSITGSLKGTR